MSIIDFINFIKGLGVTTPLYPLAFPESSPVESMIVDVGQGFNTRGSVNDITLTVIVRAEHPQNAESMANDLRSKLDLLTNQDIGGHQAIYIKAQQFVPQYLGKDTANNHFYQMDFRVLIND